MNTARFLKHVWPFFYIMHERAKNILTVSEDCLMINININGFRNFSRKA